MHHAAPHLQHHLGEIVAQQLHLEHLRVPQLRLRQL